MREDDKIKSALLRTLCSMLLCMAFVVLKFILKEEKIVQAVCNYLASDIVFLP